MKPGFVQRLWLLLLLASSVAVSAHQGSTSYLSLEARENGIIGRWEIPVRELSFALGIDVATNHQVNLDTFRERFAEVISYALPRLQISADGVAGGLVVTNDQPMIQTFADGANVALDFAITNLATQTNLVVEYRLFFDRKPEDQAFMQVACRGITQTGVFSPDQPILHFDLESHRTGNELWAFGEHGVWHIWIGFDHILFLVALLLPAVLRREQDRWQPATGFGPAIFNVFKVVTAFTVAHSVTLSLAALQILTLPSRWVESAIAGSVLVAAVNNLRPTIQKRVWLLAFSFGLIHGFGFASVLAELGLPQGALFVALLGFNLGVEAGQLAIVMVFLPLAFALRSTGFYKRGILLAGSGLIALVAGLWLVERLFNLKILPV